MKKREKKKIENKLYDAEVPDSVIYAARAEMSKPNKKRRIPTFGIKLKTALSCAASLALCLAIILPITLSALSQHKDASDSQLPDASSPSQPTYYYELDKLEKKYIDSETGGSDPIDPTEPDAPGGIPPESDGSQIKYLSQALYSDGDLAIIWEKKYAAFDNLCTVYTLKNPLFEVDVLEQFDGLLSEYIVGDLKVAYKISSGKYLASANYKEIRYYFEGEFAAQTQFESFCGYLFKNFP